MDDFIFQIATKLNTDNLKLDSTLIDCENMISFIQDYIQEIKNNE
jgi:hypothetical protein